LLASAGGFGTNTQSVPLSEGNPGSGVAFTESSFDDSSWRRLDLPHDWGIEGPFTQQFPGETGKLPWWGVGWYRKHFTVPKSDSGKQLSLEVDGAMSYAALWVNGQFAGGWPYGYASWSLDITHFIKPGADNVVAIRLDNPPDSSRWYPGGGIYRNVWLVKTAPLHVAHWGTFATTPKVTDLAAELDLQVTVQNDSGSEARPEISANILEANPEGRPAGKWVASLLPVTVDIGAGTQAIVLLKGTIDKPKRWNLRNPNRYVALTAVRLKGKTVDQYETTFGVRTIRFTADNGFLLNDVRVPLNGVCDHHDLGALGSALNQSALQRQLELLQDMGCNAIRTSHNPPAPELLELCDRLGLLVMDEAFDCWVRGKKRNDYHLLFLDWHEKDLRALIRRDRNHPCVILWSIGNEVAEQGSPAGHEVAAELGTIVHSEDLTRPVTAGCNNGRAGFNGFQKTVDVFGYNYKPTEYGTFREANPALPLFGSETASCVSSRGEYFFPVSDNKSQGRADFQVSSYDLYAPPWATPPDTEFKGQDDFPFTAGEFVWTGFDYLGEPTPYNGDTSNLLNFTDPAERQVMQRQLDELGKIRVPSRSSYFGIIDLAGFKKDRFYLYQARWRPDLKMAHILPHWNWPDRAGQVTPVHVYTSGDEAELFLNGKSLGRKTRGPREYRLRWDQVVYEPGELNVIAYKDHHRWAQDTVKTTGAAAQLVLKSDRALVNSGQRELAFVTVIVADKDGLLVPRSKNRIVFEVSGPGEIIALDNGNATSFEPFRGTEHDAYNGLCLAIIRSTGQPGEVLIKASSRGLTSGLCKLSTR
jgi:beta-galactosidase